MSIQYVCALITVEDIGRSRRFYEGLLGQTVKADFGENVAFEGGFAIHQRAHFQQLVNRPVSGEKNNNVELYFEAEDIESMEQQLRQAQVEFVHPLCAQPWLQRVLRVYDPDNHILEIGETMEAVACRLHRQGETVESICQKIMMPEAFVRQAILRYAVPA